MCAEDRAPDLLCGIKCLYVGLLTLGVEPGKYGDFVEKHGDIDARGMSLGRIDEIARKYQVHTLGVNTSLEDLRRRTGQFVCIAHVDGNHFVNIGDVTDKEVWIVDPPGEGAVARGLFAKRWKGTALLISTSPLEVESSRFWRWLSMCVTTGGALSGLWLWRRARRAP